jgi:type III pantothenate kinase
LSGVHPLQRDKLATWLRQRNEAVLVLETASQLPLRALIDQPDRVGIDRLLNAVGARCRVPEGTPLILVDAGSAVTVDWVDETGAFRGGAIFPGLRLMAQALRDHTALLPLVEVGKTSPPVPGTSTAAAIEAGVFWAAVGGINSLIEQLRSKSARVPVVFFAGGDAALLATAFDAGIQLWPTMTLEGIRVAAEAIP